MDLPARTWVVFVLKMQLSSGAPNSLHPENFLKTHFQLAPLPQNHNRNSNESRGIQQHLLDTTSTLPLAEHQNSVYVTVSVYRSCHIPTMYVLHLILLSDKQGRDGPQSNKLVTLLPCSASTLTTL